MRSRKSPPTTRRAFPSRGSRPGGALGAASPWTPTGHPPGLALHSLPTAWGYAWSPYGRRKRAQRSPLAGGRMRPVPLQPPRPPAAPVRPLPWLPRPPPTARAGRGRAPGRPPDRIRSVAAGAAPRQGPARNLHQPPRGARRLVEVAAQTPDGGRPPAAAMRECASDARRGREGHTQGAVPTPCG